MITADTITDEQIRELRDRASEEGEGVDIEDDHYGAAVLLNMCDEALGTIDYGDTFSHLPMSVALVIVEERRQWSRNRIAEILNTRSTVQP